MTARLVGCSRIAGGDDCGEGVDNNETEVPVVRRKSGNKNSVWLCFLEDDAPSDGRLHASSNSAKRPPNKPMLSGQIQQVEASKNPASAVAARPGKPSNALYT